MAKTTRRSSRSGTHTRSMRSGRSSGRRYEVASATMLGRLLPQPVRGRAAVLAQTRARQLRIGVLTVAIVLVSLVLWVGLDNRFYVYAANVEVLGAVRASHEDVFWASDLPGVHVLWARPRHAERMILKNLPNIESASVTCGLPASCTITIIERQPRLAWEEEGTVWWVGADGIVMPAQGLLTEGWLVRGPLPLEEMQEEEGDQQAEDGQRRLDEHVRVALNELWTAGVESSAVFQYVPGRGLVYTDPRGWRVVLGEGAGMAERLRTAESLGSDLQARGLTPQFVDVRFAEAPYYSLTNEW